jgi:hypothetical protein
MWMSMSQGSAGAALAAQRARGLVTAGALAVVLVVGLAACGGGSGKPAAAASTTSTTTAGRGRFGAAFAAFTSCMSQHGVKLQLPRRTGNGPRPTGEAGATPGGGGGFRGGGGFFGAGTTPSSLPPGVTASQYQAAVSTCRSKLPTGGFGGGARGGAATAAYRSCMSDHGVTLPSFGGFGSSSSSSTTASSSPPTTFDRTSPKFVAANKICMALLPARGGTTTTTAG